jgi:hypothetical protein
MADEPADVDPAEFPEERTVQCDAVPDAIDEAPTGIVEPNTPRPDVTGRHSTLTPAQFATAIDLTDRDAFARGVEHGRILERADVKTEDWEDGRDAALRALHVYLMASGFAADYSAAFVEAVRPFVKRGG